MKTVDVIILAGGCGVRAKTTIPKQYTIFNGTTCIEQCIKTFQSHPKIHTIHVVIDSQHRQYYDACCSDLKLNPPIIGGKTRTHSSINGVSVVNSEYVLIHDVARPFITHEIIDNVINGFTTHDAVIPCIAVTDSIKSHDGKNIDRNTLWATQTPQGFKTSIIKQAYTSNKSFTDDASAVETLTDIKIVNGCETNIKMTTQQDFINNTTSIPRIGYGYDVHAFEKGDHIILCGVKIPHTKGFTAHSDGDVAMHALTDALYGAIGNGDIGYHFPPSDNQWKNADSSIFLKHAVKCITDKGGYISNVDITIICEQPKITPYRDTMRQALSTIMNLDMSHISIKATTSEKLGFTGRTEGIASSATALIIV